ncbi:MAG: DUF1501 domain-containing protein [Bryobacteraceae bacterium]
MPTRRVFLRRSALAMAGVGMTPAWLERALEAKQEPRGKILVAVFQRGAADGLNMVIPFGEKRYATLRPTIGIPVKQAIDVNGFFALHPSLEPLKPAWDAKQLAVVHAVGSPDPTRSHFDAQDYMESGTPGRKSTGDGWMNRALRPASGEPSPVRAVALGPSLPRSLRGGNPAVAVNGLSNFRVRDEEASAAFQTMYAESVDATLQGAGKETFEAIRLLQSLQKSPYRPSGGAVYPRGRLGQSLQQVAQLIKAGVGLELAFADMGGWDHHVNEAGAQPVEGQLANLLSGFGQALAAFHRDLGDRMEDVVLVTMSEFGRTAAENGNRGTDHGHANCMLILGGPVRGGKVYGKWPGLEREQLYEGRDLAVTTDFRDVLSEVAMRHLGHRGVAGIFPGFAPDRGNVRGLLG